MSKRSKIPSFNDVYFTGQVKSEIYKIKVNKNLPKISGSALENEYKALGITKLDEASLKGITHLSSLEKKKFINEYNHRDELIATGQYRDYRNKVFHENYIKALIKNNADPAYIKFFQKLSDSQFVSIAYIPKGKNDKEDLKNDSRTRFLIPMPTMYYQDSVIVRDDKNDESVDIENAIDIAGLRDVMNSVLESMKEEDSLLKRKANTPRLRAIYDAMKRSTQSRIDKPQMTARIIGTIPKSVRDSIIIPSFSSVSSEHEMRYKIYEQLEAKGKLYNKYGNINFVSNNEKRGYQYWKNNK
jgi:hypothetical protein